MCLLEGGRRRMNIMVDWDMAVRIAAGGFGLVFLLLAMLACSVWVTKEVLERIEKRGEDRKQA